MMAGIVLVGGFAALCAAVVGWFLGEAAADRRREKQADRERESLDRARLYTLEGRVSRAERILAHHGLEDPRRTGCPLADGHSGGCAPGRPSRA